MSEEGWITIKVRRSPTEKARVLSGLRGQNLGEYVSDIIDAEVSGPYETLMKNLPPGFRRGDFGRSAAPANGAPPAASRIATEEDMEEMDEDTSDEEEETPSPEPELSHPTRSRKLRGPRPETAARNARIVEMKRADPRRTQASIAKELKCAASYVSKVLSDAGITTS